MDKTVVYVVLAEEQLPELLVSVYSLRRWYGGNVVVYCIPSLVGVVREMSVDQRLGFTLLRLEQAYEGPSSGILCTLQAVRSLEYDLAVFLDTATLVRGDIDELFDRSRRGLLAIQSNNDRATDSIRQASLKAMSNIKGLEELAMKTMAVGGVAVGNRVFGCMPKSPALTRWQDLITLCGDVPDAASIALQILVGTHNAEEVATETGIWQSDPSVIDIKKHDAIQIWVFKNQSYAQTKEHPRAVAIWYPVYDACKFMNVGNVKAWIDRVLISNPYLSNLKGIQ